jgi:hypothetical protein
MSQLISRSITRALVGCRRPCSLQVGGRGNVAFALEKLPSSRVVPERSPGNAKAAAWWTRKRNQLLVVVTKKKTRKPSSSQQHTQRAHRCKRSDGPRIKWCRVRVPRARFLAPSRGPVLFGQYSGSSGPSLAGPCFWPVVHGESGTEVTGDDGSCFWRSRSLGIGSSESDAHSPQHGISGSGYIVARTRRGTASASTCHAPRLFLW